MVGEFVKLDSAGFAFEKARALWCRGRIKGTAAIKNRDIPAKRM
jgi:hypothetical protein